MQYHLIPARHLSAMLSDGEEIAVLDPRPEGQFTQEHLLLAASMPEGRLEFDMPWRVPRLNTRIVLVDDSPTRAERVRALLASTGYSHVLVLDAFLSHCAAAGLGLFSGKHVPSKAFGEVVETTLHTPRIDTRTLLAWQREGKRLLMVDSRTPREFQQFTLPGALSCPGAELVPRVAEAAAGFDTVVVNCAGRTRSIIGAQSLINAGVGEHVVALENGTMAWHLDGHALTYGQTASLTPPRDAEALARASSAALALLRRSGGRLLGWDELQALRADARRTTYFYDVRPEQAFRLATLPFARHAPGGELVQATDQFMPVRHARVVLMDTDLVQAPMTAHWLRQMGWEADVLDPADAPARAPAQQQAGPWLRPHTPVDRVTPQWLHAELRDGRATVIDCASSIGYRHAHIPGAWFCARPVPPQAMRSAGAGDLVLVFTAEEEAMARFAAGDALNAGQRAAYLGGGTQAWRDAGFNIESGATRMLGACDDVWYSPYELAPALREQAMRDYITWEVGLTDCISAEPGVHFKVLGPT